MYNIRNMELVDSAESCSWLIYSCLPYFTFWIHFPFSVLFWLPRYRRYKREIFHCLITCILSWTYNGICLSFLSCCVLYVCTCSFSSCRPEDHSLIFWHPVDKEFMYFWWCLCMYECSASFRVFPQRCELNIGIHSVITLPANILHHIFECRIKVV